MGSLFQDATWKLWPQPDRVVLSRSRMLPSWRTPAGSGSPSWPTPRGSRPSTSMRADDRTDRHDVGGALVPNEPTRKALTNVSRSRRVVTASAFWTMAEAGSISSTSPGCTRARSSSRSCPSPTTRRRLTLRVTWALNDQRRLGDAPQLEPSRAASRLPRAIQRPSGRRPHQRRRPGSFTANGTWTAPTGIRFVRIYTASAGRRGAATATGIPGQQQRRRGGWRRRGASMVELRAADSGVHAERRVGAGGGPRARRHVLRLARPSRRLLPGGGGAPVVRLAERLRWGRGGGAGMWTGGTGGGSGAIAAARAGRGRPRHRGRSASRPRRRRGGVSFQNTSSASPGGPGRHPDVLPRRRDPVGGRRRGGGPVGPRQRRKRLPAAGSLTWWPGTAGGGGGSVRGTVACTGGRGCNGSLALAAAAGRVASTNRRRGYRRRRRVRWRWRRRNRELVTR